MKSVPLVDEPSDFESVYSLRAGPLLLSACHKASLNQQRQASFERQRHPFGVEVLQIHFSNVVDHVDSLYFGSSSDFVVQKLFYCQSGYSEGACSVLCIAQSY